LISLYSTGTGAGSREYSGPIAQLASKSPSDSRGIKPKTERTDEPRMNANETARTFANE
jgi:hypothetical protein